MDEEYIMHYKNAIKQGYKLSIDSEYSNNDCKDWYAINNFGINSFSFNLAFLPIAKIRYDIGLYMSYIIVCKILLYFR